MKKNDEHSQGLKPLTIGIALGASAGVWLLVEVLRRVLQ